MSRSKKPRDNRRGTQSSGLRFPKCNPEIFVAAFSVSGGCKMTDEQHERSSSTASDSKHGREGDPEVDSMMSSGSI
jgi:hypothetical protein